MSTTYKTISARTPDELDAALTDALSGGYQPVSGMGPYIIEQGGVTCMTLSNTTTIATTTDGATVVVHNSAGSTVAGTHVAEVAGGALTDVKLASTVAPVTNGQVLNGVTPSGTYVSHITFTVTNGAITAVALS